MYRLLAILAATLGLGAPAFAADLQPRPLPPVVNVLPWSGFYVGADVGALFNTTLSPVNDSKLLDLPHFKMSGITYGGFVGHNWQIGAAVVGLEVNFDFANRRASNTIEESISATDTIKYLGSARARLGFTLGTNILAYGTAGVGWANTQASIAEGSTVVGNAAANHFGWVGGGGLEYMFAANWTARLEYLHYGLGQSSYAFSVPINLNFVQDLKVDTVRFGLAYKFGV